MDTRIPWQKSSKSADTGDCLEAAAHHGQILIRESDDPTQIVTTTPAKLAAFIEGVKAGEFDHLIS
ncbi:uncharacterized protein DUF397 [Streptomyces sp. 3211.6]|uniref:DUF397 domain-containing protein n=1 Tax=Streptomyces sp. 3211.6 TaxID=1938845 RepID=UPI000C2BAD8C|nr:DUF397 domain-containing protein [Streptomyces sp. 3211.6]RKT06149.1 uncharacterized protein DUF397 [Streptomyces sp. 3211.6]